MDDFEDFEDFECEDPGITLVITKQALSSIAFVLAGALVIAFYVAAINIYITEAGLYADLDLPVMPPTLDEVLKPAPPIEWTLRDLSPPTLFGEEIQLENDSICYVVDGSGSMNYLPHKAVMATEEEESRWDIAKSELKISIGGLAPNIKFNVVKYNCVMTLMSPDLVKATAANKLKAFAWLDSWEPNSVGIWGGTGTGPAVALGLSFETLNVALITDGAPNCPWWSDTFRLHRNAIRGANTQGARIDVFGIAASGDYRSFCQGVAADSGGNFYEVR